MDPQYSPPIIDLIQTYAMHGLLHGRRNCQFCLAEMRFIKMERNVEKDGYGWVCPTCFRGVPFLDSTPLHTINFRNFDTCVQLFSRGFQPCGSSGNMIGKSLNDKVNYFQIIRKAYCLYWGKAVLPFLQFTGPVELDETLISRKRWNPFSKLPTLRWAFGMICRQTKIPVIFYIQNKSYWTLVQIIKKYTQPG
jgi:hypothetical protein